GYAQRKTRAVFILRRRASQCPTTIRVFPKNRCPENRTESGHCEFCIWLIAFELVGRNARPSSCLRVFVGSAPSSQWGSQWGLDSSMCPISKTWECPCATCYERFVGTRRYFHGCGESCTRSVRTSFIPIARWR